MTTIEAVRAELAADAAVTALVGERIYPQVAPQGAAPPYVVMTVVSDVPSNTFDGSPATRLVQSRIQVDCYARMYREARAVADAVDGVLGALSRPDLIAQREMTQESYENDAELHRVSMDFLVWR